MKHQHLKNILRACCALSLAAAAVAADRIELTDGSVVLGQLLSAGGGKFTVKTAFAGMITIAQDQIKSFQTDEPVNVRTGTGTILGRVQPAGAETVVIAGGSRLTVVPGQVTALWPQGTESPDARHWQYEAGLAITGRTGGSEKFAGALGFKATLESPQDKLVFALQAEKSRDNGVETANRQFASADYSAFVSANNVWYARTSLEKDEIKALDLRSTTGAGIGRKLIKNAVQDLELRAGLSYVYEKYANGTNFDSPGLDLGLIHTYQFKNGRLANSLTYTPAFEDFGNYRIHHESTYEMPITASLWKLRVGLTNDYTSIPQPGIDRLDTLYFTSLILNWK
jgi:hypothetical protein